MAGRTPKARAIATARAGAIAACSIIRNLHPEAVTTKRRKRLAIVLFTVIAGVVAYGLLNREEAEPKYQGRDLSDWLEQYRAGRLHDPDGEAKKDAAAAVQRIGTNALPYLLKWIADKPPAWRTALREKLPCFVRNREFVAGWLGEETEQLRQYAGEGFDILGTNAVNAIPELLTIVKNSATAEVWGAALSAITSIGTPVVIPALKAALADPNQPDRDQIIYVFGWIALIHGTNVGLPTVIEALNDDDLKVRIAATNALNWQFKFFTNAPAQ
jgi:hypothetical protein